jgi:hypothetical protein
MSEQGQCSPAVSAVHITKRLAQNRLDITADRLANRISNPYPLGQKRIPELRAEIIVREVAFVRGYRWGGNR